ncbi:hypothetical protein ABPG77_008249 [Micractinium sp. CCAP 211/92]
MLLRGRKLQPGRLGREELRRVLGGEVLLLVAELAWVLSLVSLVQAWSVMKGGKNKEARGGTIRTYGQRMGSVVAVGAAPPSCYTTKSPLLAACIGSRYTLSMLAGLVSEQVQPGLPLESGPS